MLCSFRLGGKWGIGGKGRGGNSMLLTGREFTHKKHADALKIDCMASVYHTWKAGETSGKLCLECHKAKAEGKAVAAKDAFHKDCKGCHDDAKKANKPAGPTGCTQCHVKAK